MSKTNGACVAIPRHGSGPGVLVLHEAWGLTHDIRWAADRLAGLGYVAMAPDLTPYMRGLGGALAQLVTARGPMIDAALTAVDILGAHPAVTSDGIGIVGFSMGAGVAQLCDRHPKTTVMSLNYGMVPRRAFAVRPIPVVASFGGNDRLLPTQGGRLQRLLASFGVDRDIHVYPGVGHSFMTPIGSRSIGTTGALLGLGYNSTAANHAWRRLGIFFDERLHPANQTRPSLIRALAS